MAIFEPNARKLMEEEEHDRLTDATEIIFYEMPKLEQQVQDILTGKTDMEPLSEEEKWCIYMRYRHEARAAKLIKELSLKEEGIMWAERAAAKIDRDFDKALRRMNEIKNSMDLAQLKYDARHEGLAEGKAEGRAQGLAEGKAEGKAEAMLEIARKMKGMGDSIEKIQAITGLPTETLKEI